MVVVWIIGDTIVLVLFTVIKRLLGDALVVALLLIDIHEFSVLVLF